MHIIRQLIFKRTFWLSVPIAAGLVYAAVYTPGTVAQDTAGTAQPGTRCTRLMWPKISKKEIEAYKSEKVGVGQPGARCGRMYAKRTAKILPNQPPVIGHLRPQFGSDPDETVWDVSVDGKLMFSGIANDPDGDTILHTWSVTGGRIDGEGPTTVWDLTGVAPGTYTITAEVDDGCGCIAFKSSSVRVHL